MAEEKETLNDSNEEEDQTLNDPINVDVELLDDSVAEVNVTSGNSVVVIDDDDSSDSVIEVRPVQRPILNNWTRYFIRQQIALLQKMLETLDARLLYNINGREEFAELARFVEPNCPQNVISWAYVAIMSTILSLRGRRITSVQAKYYSQKMLAVMMRYDNEITSLPPVNDDVIMESETDLDYIAFVNHTVTATEITENEIIEMEDDNTSEAIDLTQTLLEATATNEEVDYMTAGVQFSDTERRLLNIIDCEDDDADFIDDEFVILGGGKYYSSSSSSPSPSPVLVDEINDSEVVEVSSDDERVNILSSEEEDVTQPKKTKVCRKLAFESPPKKKKKKRKTSARKTRNSDAVPHGTPMSQEMEGSDNDHESIIDLTESPSPVPSARPSCSYDNPVPSCSYDNPVPSCSYDNPVPSCSYDNPVPSCSYDNPGPSCSSRPPGSSASASHKQKRKSRTDNEVDKVFKKLIRKERKEGRKQLREAELNKIYSRLIDVILARKKGNDDEDSDEQ